MSYVEKNLIPGETLIYRTGVHWSVLVGPAVVAAILAAPGIAILAYRDDIGGHGVPANVIIVAGIALIVLAGMTFAYSVIKKDATEIAVTNRRVIIKTGMTSRRSLEIMIGKVESIGIDETVMGRMLGYGTVVIHGTGGTPEPFRKIAHPSEFRMAVQQQVDAATR
jgi:uncharacterized membrane protein YdbT with pleckstrin-like domain